MSGVYDSVNDKPHTTATYLKHLRGTTSQRDLAKMIGVSDGAIAQVETGHRPLSAQMLERIADALELAAGQRAQLRVLRLNEQVERLRSELAALEAEMQAQARAAQP